MPSDARACAYAVVRRVFEQGAYADRALPAESGRLDRRDRALAKHLAYGTIQRKLTLDALIATLAERPPRRLDRPVLAALRLGLYELLYSDGAPDRAVVADSVQLAKDAGRGDRGASGARGGVGRHNGPGPHGLVNAVLRRATREGRALLDALDDTTPGQAAIKHSHPPWLASLWWEELGAERARALMAADNEPGELALRANTLVTDARALARALARPDPAHGTAAVRTHGDPLVPEALVLDDPFDAHGSPLWREGAFLAQSRAAMLVARLLAPRAGERVLDLCAAPGGKSTHLAALMDGSGELLAVEHNRARAGALARTARRLHAGNVRIELADATLPHRDGPVFDRVLVDPPCSGLGTLQARPDLRWRRQPEQLRQLAQTQNKILTAGSQAVRPGGLLVYSTCTISAIENERQIAAFLDANPGFGLDDLRAELPALSNPRAPDTVLTVPDRDHTAGFFIARLRREE
ncbi:MAG TPA: 16S rRNA (cytosine(967)-C(5))-methyltransferase RsmB [Solirubrobacteraceae bacterium]|nr:16S rRNA (cytosine(967)-C(5))-methyltransferase RsmB [Solirubrobacteraceae bacterium]